MLRSAERQFNEDLARSPERAVCDPVKLEIVRGAIMAAQREMEALIERTAISAFIREKKDFYTALFDAEGVMAVGSMVPIFGDLTKPVLDRFPIPTMQPGDVYWYNDCYASQGAVSHSNDQVLLAPVFESERLCAFVMSWAHFADIGGLRAGSISPDTTEIFQEGIIVPPTRLVTAGMVNEAALAIFHRNSRFPEQSVGDMSALMASVELGATRVAQIFTRFGQEVVTDALAQLLARTRRIVRKKLAETFPYGTHRFTDAIDGDGHGHGPFKIRFALTREKGFDGEDRFIFDATETDDEAPGPVNLLMNPGIPGMALGLYFLGGDPAQVCNAGGPKALDEVRLREGSLVQPRFPAPLGMRGLTLMRVLAALNGLVNAAGGGAPASHSAYVISLVRGSYTDEANVSRSFLLADGVGVGYGARSFADGLDAVYFVAQENYPVEFLELAYPVRLRRYGVVPDSGGPGRFRGGCGIVREYEILADHAVMACRIDGVANPPWGINGGKPGGVGRVTLNPGTPDERPIEPLSDGNVLKYGDVVCMETGGGGGYGDPFERPADAVLEDVAGGFVSAESAARDYGVAIVEGGIDWVATSRLRSRRLPVSAAERYEAADVVV
jgi:N-methylhydantoinase B